MKKISIISFLTIAIGAYTFHKAYTHPGGESASGQPGEEKGCVKCHGASSGSGSVKLESNIPVTGYTLGKTYQMTLTITDPTQNKKFGFSISAQNNTNTSAGTIVKTDGTRTNIFGGNHLTHTRNYFNTNPAVIKFDWTAPTSGSSPVKFYFDGLATNNDGKTGGDHNYMGTKIFNRAIQTSVEENGILDIKESLISIYPNPTQSYLKIHAPEASQNTVYSIYSSSGAKMSENNEYVEGEKISIENLPSGNYFIKMNINGKDVRKAFVKQ